MKKLTKLQYEVIFLYSKGLTFKEIDTILTTASRGVYNQVLSKDKGRVTRAKISREININRYKEKLKNYLDKVKENNKHYRKSVTWIREKNIIPIIGAKKIFRTNYKNECLNKSLKSYNKYKLTFIRKLHI